MLSLIHHSIHPRNLGSESEANAQYRDKEKEKATTALVERVEHSVYLDLDTGNSNAGGSSNGQRSSDQRRTGGHELQPVGGF